MPLLKTLKNTEFIILAVMWLAHLATFSISMLNNYELEINDYLGFIGLLMATIFSVLHPDRAFLSLLFLLVAGVFNIFSFLYFFNVVVKLNLSIMKAPGIQLFSLILLATLVLRRKSKILQWYRTFSGSGRH